MKINLEQFILGTIIVLMLILVLYPMILIFWQSFIVDEIIKLGKERLVIKHFSLGNYIDALGDKHNIVPLKNTLILGLLTTLFSVLIGAPLAWLVIRTNLIAASKIRSIMLIPYMVPPFIGAIAWEQLLTRDVGYFNKFIVAMIGSSPFDIHSFPGLIWVMTLMLYPMVFLTTAGALERMDPTLEEAARISGSNNFKVMKDITLPLVAPSIAAGAILVFIQTIGNFGIPALIGMQAHIFVMTTQIYAHLTSIGNIKIALVLSTILMALAFAGVYSNQIFFRDKQFSIIAGKSMRPNVVDLGFLRIPILVALGFFLLITVVSPFVSIFFTSLLKAWGAKLTFANLTLHNFHYILFEYGETQNAFINSFLLAISAATITTFFGAIIAYILVKTKTRGKTLLDTVTTLPYSLPGVVVAVAMILAWSGRIGINLYDTFWIILMAYIVNYLTLAVRTVSSSLSQIHDSLEEAVRISGGSWLRSFKDVVIPLIRPGLIAGWFLIFMPTLRELNMSIMLAGPETKTLGVAVYEMQDAGYYQISAALAVVILSVVIFGNIIIRKFSGGKLGL
ncbi:MAG: hypothetical protein B6244_01680 [Candidatus Cloacimonetes bacterium 4572_55]|nr:MAG: hypothetical protein B6244_01680 [Candidatus Cloacimonetes bacterium 4572_55]